MVEYELVNGVARPKPQSEPEPDAPFKDHCEARTPEQISFYDALPKEFAKAFSRMMLPRGRASAGMGGVDPRYGEMLEKMHDIWVEYTGYYLEEWT